MSRCRTMLEIDRKREITGLERVASYQRYLPSGVVNVLCVDCK